MVAQRRPAHVLQGNRAPADVPLRVVLVVALLLLASAAAADKYSGRVVISYATGSARGDASARHAVTALMRRRRRLEDEVAPELSSGWPASLRTGHDNRISYNALNAGKPACGNSCPAPGGSYTRPCTYANGCFRPPH